MAKTDDKLKRGPLWLVGRIAVVCAMAYLVVSLVAGQMSVAQMQRQLAEAEAQVQQQTEENEELQRIMNSEDEAAYIEKKARELGYAKPDERIYVDISGE